MHLCLTQGKFEPANTYIEIALSRINNRSNNQLENPFTPHQNKNPDGFMSFITYHLPRIRII